MNGLLHSWIIFASSLLPGLFHVPALFLLEFQRKQDDLQGLASGNVRDGNWITGISFIDNSMYGDQSLLPDSLKHNKAHNTLYMLLLYWD